MLDRIYLDNAATTWPKPESVYLAIDRMQRVIGAPAGRGAYGQAVEVQRMLDRTRQQIAELIHAPQRRSIVFTFSGTDSLSTALFGILREGDHVVTSEAEHNSVLRPLRWLESQGRNEVMRVKCNAEGRWDAADVVAAIRPGTRLVALSHVSNVTGAIEPVEEVGRFCRENGTVFLLDAAQSLGQMPLDVHQLGCDLLAAPGHKGLFGPLGTGVLFVSEQLQAEMQPLRYGGTGSTGPTDEQPAEFPAKMEAGNLNVPGIAGIHAGIEYLNSSEAAERMNNLESLKARFLAGLLHIPRLHLQGPRDPANRLAIFSVNLDSFSCVDVAGLLDANWSIQTRAGFHCAPRLHRALETVSCGGTLRFSLGLFNTVEEIDQTLDALRLLADG